MPQDTPQHVRGCGDPRSAPDQSRFKDPDHGVPEFRRSGIGRNRYGRLNEPRPAEHRQKT